jgi:hypothetical protein
MTDGRAAKRFQAKVDQRGPDDCWPWTAGTTTKGYGSFRVKAGQVVSAHGFAKLLATGVACPPGLIPLHTCKTPLSQRCCNPDHIVYAPPGSTTIPVRGEQHPCTKLSDAQVRAIRARALAGEAHTAIAAEYGIGYRHVSNIKNGRARAGA